jgi:hypothetical protein
MLKVIIFVILSFISSKVIKLSFIMLNVLTLRVILQNAIVLRVIILNVIFVERHYAECRHSDCRGAVQNEPKTFLKRKKVFECYLAAAITLVVTNKTCKDRAHKSFYTRNLFCDVIS